MSFIDNIFDRSIPALTQGLDLFWKRNQAITSNISNAETPAYRAVDVNFAGQLEKAFEGQSSREMIKTNSKHMDIASNQGAHLVEDFSGATKADGNNVDIDIQMGKLIMNSGQYSQGTNLVRKKLHMLRTAIREAMR